MSYGVDVRGVFGAELVSDILTSSGGGGESEFNHVPRGMAYMAKPERGMM